MIHKVKKKQINSFFILKLNLSYFFKAIIEVVKILHRNILNSASNLKIAHESVQVKFSLTEMFQYLLITYLFSSSDS